jgi:hypothetical protein
MRTTVALFGAIALIAPTLVLACKKDDSSQPAPGAYPTASSGTQSAYSAATAAAPGTGAPGAMAVPGPAALPCSNDSMCMTHRCNLQYGKCSFPCESDGDCIRGAYCFKSVISTCLPKPPGAP